VTVTNDAEAPGIIAGGFPASRQRAWWPVHEFIEAVVPQANYGPIPAAGTPAWCELAQGDPRKLLALAIDGEHHVLRVETAQEALAQASRDVAESADWSGVARGIQRRASGVYIARRVA
jgi:hypothetical protein